MQKRIDKSQVSFATAEEHDKKDKEYWARASAEEKFATITYLRECFYGPEATTGRLQRIYRFVKLK